MGRLLRCGLRAHLGPRFTPGEEEASALWRILALAPGSRVLDAPCGYGRVSVPLARLGATVLGVDQSAPLLAEAERRRGEVGPDRARFLRHDLRAPLAESGFDAALNLFTSLGYGSEEDYLAILHTLGAAVREGGAVAIDTMHRDVVAAFLARDITPAHRLPDGTLVNNRHLRRISHQVGAQIGNVKRRKAAIHRHLAQGFHHTRHIYALGTAAETRLARSARPNSLSLKNVFQAQLSHAKDLVGEHVERKRDRAARRALATLVAGEQVLPADVFNLLDEIAVNRLCRKSSSHKALRQLPIVGSPDFNGTMVNLAKVLEAIDGFSIQPSQGFPAQSRRAQK